MLLCVCVCLVFPWRDQAQHRPEEPTGENESIEMNEKSVTLNIQHLLGVNEMSVTYMLAA